MTELAPFALGPFLTGVLIGLGIVAGVEAWAWVRR